ncbi:MAG: type II secretion system protein [Nitrospirota bacterium]
MKSILRPLSGRAGFTYMGMLVIIMVIGITSAVVGQSLRLAAKREKERELLWRGNQFRLAVERYYEGKSIPGKAGLNQWPTSLDDLMEDPRSGNKIRYLRKKYIDPMTGKDDWVMVPPGGSQTEGGYSVAGGPIGGVHSNSDAKPLKMDNFDLADIKFRGKVKYSQWEFVFDPNAANGAATVTVTPTGGPILGGTTPGGTTPGGTTPGGLNIGGTTPGGTATGPATGGGADDF